MPPVGTSPVPTFSRQKVDQHSHGGDEDARHDDVDDVEERLALDDEVEDDLLVLDVIWGEVVRIDDLPSGAVLDGPLTVLCRAAVPRESHCPAGGTGAASPLAEGGEGEGWCSVWAPQCTQDGQGAGKGARAAGEGDEHCGACQGAWAKYPKKLVEAAAGHRWGTSSPSGAPRVSYV